MSSICPQPGCPNFRPCPTHRTTTGRRGYDYQWQKVSAAARAAQPWCSLCGSREDLTADHVVPLAQGGDGTYVQVLCRKHNSQKGAR